MGSSDSSVRSRSGERLAPTWDSNAPATDFAITTVNVPDRLDMQEVRAREEEDSYQRRSWFSLDRYTINVWTRRLVALGVVGGLGWLAWAAIEPVTRGLSPEAISARLSASTGLPVKVGSREVEMWPRPRVVLRDVSLGPDLKAAEVALQPNWEELVQSAKLGRLALSEAVVSPMRLTAAQATSLVAVGPRLSGVTGLAVSTVRITGVEFPEFPLLPHQYDIVIRRDSSGQPAPVRVIQTSGEGRLQLAATPLADGTTRLELEAQNWRAPVGPGIPWSTVSATATVLPSAVVVDSYTATSGAGVLQGAMVAGNDVAWSVAATARTVSLDLETVMRQLGGRSAEDTAVRAPLLGTATLTLVGSGHGPSLTDAMFGARMFGPVSVRWGTLNGINLGLAATQGGASESSGGTTRFTELTASAEIGQTGVVLRDIEGRAGAMATRGQLAVAEDLTLSGALRVDLGATRVQAPATLRVGGTAIAPRFGRQP